MKIIELQEIFEPAISHKKYRGNFDNKYPKRTPDELGRGSFSIARPDKSDPHTIKKRQYNDPNRKLRDAFQLYAKEVADNSLWDEINFPRIYEIKSFSDKSNKTLHKWKMEKLIRLHDLTPEDLKSLGEKYDIPPKHSEDPFELSNYIADLFHGDKTTNNERLSKSISILRKIYEKLQITNRSIFEDLGSYNIMVRRTQHGFDLVFSDPFAFNY